ncbi:Ig-like domain-containing protein [Nocardioides sp. SYSU DS0651]|uniref:Ig-like domain-containing protein n=1 Tax=Nocardioides sp. SYSU DS0651 TaxID=3415955 RepID=UPI003F4BED7F
MHRLTAALATLALALGLTVVLASTAAADITAPGNGAVLRGNATLSASGASDGTWCARADEPRTTLQLVNSGGTVVLERVHNGTGAKSSTFDTHAFPNGAYKARAIERNRSGFVLCNNNTRTTERNVTIDNLTQLAYSGATEGAQNTSVTARATLTDPNLPARVLPGRTVSFSLSGGATVTATTNASGVATASLPVSGPPRNATVTASFAQTSYYKGSSASSAFTVEKNSSTTTLQPPPPIVHGQPVTFTAQVARVDGTSTPTGTVQFTLDGKALGSPVAVVDGLATTPSIDSLATGSHALGARYAGDGNLLPSDAAAVTFSVAKASTTTTLTSTGSPTVSGEPVTFTATVDVVAPGVGQPGGAVQFDVDGDPYGTAVPLTGDSAELTIKDLAPGNHRVQATYNGNADFAESSSAELAHGVDRADTAVTVTTSNAEAVAGEPLTFTADVDVVGPGAGEPTGTVQFAAGGEPIGDPVPITGGTAVSGPVGLDAGTHTITATYEGDARFAGGSATLEQEVASGHTTTTVTTSPNPSVVGQPVTVRVEVAPVRPAQGTPGGAVQITIDGEPGPFVTLEDGVAEFSSSTLTRGSHEITARYLSADPNFVTSTSPVATHTVNKAATRTELTSSAPTSVTGQPVTFTATVSVLAPGAGSPTGTLVFRDGDTVLGSAPVGAGTGGVGSITVDSLSVGQHAITVSYDGDDDFTGSTDSVAQRVQRAQTATVLTSSANPSESGAPVRFTATVSPVAPGAGSPGGTVQFTVNGAPLGAAVALADGEATSPDFDSLTPGVYRIGAVYSGDPGFVGSTGLLDQGNGQEVTRAGTTMELASDAPVADQGQTVTFTATVRTVAPATGRATGTVQFWAGDTLLGAAGLDPADEARTSVASYSTAGLAPGQHEIRAVYEGSFNFQGQSATITQNVGAVATVTGIASDANPATYGQGVTLTAVVSDAAPTAGRPTGEVVFRAGDQVLGSAPLRTVDGRQQAALRLERLDAGEHAVTASYGGDESRSASTSPVLTQVVDRAPSRLSNLDVTYYQLNTVQLVQATLTGVEGAPLEGQRLVFTTTSTLAGGHRLLCEAVTDAAGFASCRIPPFLAGPVRNEGFDVTFAGSANHLPVTEHGTTDGP